LLNILFLQESNGCKGLEAQADGVAVYRW